MTDRIAADREGYIVGGCPEPGCNRNLSGSWGDFYSHMQNEHGWLGRDFSGYVEVSRILYKAGRETVEQAENRGGKNDGN